MKEIVFSAPDEDFFLSEAARLGFMSPDGKVIITGTFASGGGWFLAIQGTVYEPQPPTPIGEDPPPPVPRPGYFGRLRINGEPEGFPQFAPEIVQYIWSPDVGPVDPDTGLHSGGWTSDGVTLAPDWISTIGMIA